MIFGEKRGGEAARSTASPPLYQAVAGHSAAKQDSSLQSEHVSFRYDSTQKMVEPKIKVNK